MFKAPIPGMSLTGEPKKYPWERPPELNAPEEVANYYLDKLTDEKTLESILDYLAVGDLTLKELVEGITRVGVSKGLHTIDAGLLVAPLVHKTLKIVADSVGVEYDEGLVDKKAEDQKAKDRKRLLTKKMLSKIEKSPEVSPLEEEVELPKEDKPKGLVQRRK